MKDWPSTLQVKLTSGLTVDLPLVRDEETGVSFYSFNMIGRARWCAETAALLYAHVVGLYLPRTPTVLVTAEAKAIALTQEMASIMGHDRYVVLRKSKKSYMRDPVSFAGDTVISGSQEYWIDRDDADFLRGKDVVVVDDVISTGGTAKTFLEVASTVGFHVAAFACVLTEDEDRSSFDGIPLAKLNHIPFPGRTG